MAGRMMMPSTINHYNTTKHPIFARTIFPDCYDDIPFLGSPTARLSLSFTATLSRHSFFMAGARWLPFSVLDFALCTLFTPRCCFVIP